MNNDVGENSENIRDEKPLSNMEFIKNKEVKNPTPNKLYLKLFEITKSSLNSIDALNKDSIVNVVKEVADTLINDNYNELLLSFYSESRDNYLAAHIANNVILSLGFGISLGLKDNDLIDLGICAFCHDFGMNDYKDLFQKNSVITQVEAENIQKHTLKSAEIFKPIFSQKIIDSIIDIHEQVDGGGYPNRKYGDAISILARIVSVCDVFEALTHSRNYRKKFNPYEAMKMIIKKKDIIFDGRIIKKFVEYMSIYPIGSIVNLNTGETALVIGSNKGYPTCSIVRILLNPKKEIESSKKIVNLLQDNMIYITGCLDLKEESEIIHFLNPRAELSL